MGINYSFQHFRAIELLAEKIHQSRVLDFVKVDWDNPWISILQQYPDTAKLATETSLQIGYHLTLIQCSCAVRWAEDMKNSHNSVTQEKVEELLDQAKTEEHVFWKRELVVSYLLPNGFTVSGRSACIDPTIFDLEIGREIARKDAIAQLWKLESYALQKHLHETGALQNMHFA